MNIVFLLSLPRSGSTLVQRILGSHTEIATRTEPWLLLPLVYMTKESGVFSEYAHRHSNRAIRELIGAIEDGQVHFDDCIREFTYTVYGKTCGGSERFFLDKTPRYSIVADRLLEIFKEEKFIVVWRNPLAIVSSIVRTWSRDRFFLWGSITDLYDGFEILHSAFVNNRERFLSIKYEDFLQDSEGTLKNITGYLGLEYDSSLLERFAETQLDGFYGDKKGYQEYSSVKKELADKWKENIDNPFRKRWCRKYLQWIGTERLKDIGYTYEELLAEIDAIPNRNHFRMFTDFFYYYSGVFVRFIEPFILKYKFMNLKSRGEKVAFLS